MVQKLIELALRNRLIVLLLAGGLFAYGIYSVKKNPIDAIPDLSENQVIVFTEWMGRSPQVMEDQVTYPLVSNLQGIPKIKNIRGGEGLHSPIGMSAIDVGFLDGRGAVRGECLAQFPGGLVKTTQSRLPQDVLLDDAPQQSRRVRPELLLVGQHQGCEHAPAVDQ